MQKILRFVILFSLCLLFIPSLCHSFTGKVISIADGDTITILSVEKNKPRSDSTASTHPKKASPLEKLQRSLLPSSHIRSR